MISAHIFYLRDLKYIHGTERNTIRLSFDFVFLLFSLSLQLLAMLKPSENCVGYRTTLNYRKIKVALCRKMNLHILIAIQ